jgi:hypothetical protein
MSITGSCSKASRFVAGGAFWFDMSKVVIILSLSTSIVGTMIPAQFPISRREFL